MSNRLTIRHNLKYLHQHTSLLDKIIGLGVLFATFFLLTSVYYQVRAVRLLEITSPVLLDKSQYRRGDVISGFFEGEVFTDVRPTVRRFIICAKRSYALTDRIALGGRRTLNGKRAIDIARLGSSDLEVADTTVAPDTNCYIRFINEYKITTLGITRTESVRYFSDTFDIVE